MSKDLIYGHEARVAIIEGVDFLADAVKVTLGPKGRNVAISRRLIGLGLNPLVTKDGVTVANHTLPALPKHQIGADLAREAANRCVYATGDGTTTTTVLVQGMVHAGANFIARGIDPWSMKRGIDKAAALVIEQLETIARPVETPEQTFHVANISSNGDEAIASMVCDAFRQVLVLYLERPPRNSAQLESLQGALRIQRLEGSRPHGSLCTLNRSERVQRDQAQTESGIVR